MNLTINGQLELESEICIEPNDPQKNLEALVEARFTSIAFSQQGMRAYSGSVKDDHPIFDGWHVLFQFLNGKIATVTIQGLSKKHGYTDSWCAELEDQRFKHHVQWLTEYGLKRKKYPWGHISVAKDKGYRFSGINISYR